MDFLIAVIVSVFGIVVYLPWKFVYVCYQSVVVPFQGLVESIYGLVVVAVDTWSSILDVLMFLPFQISVGIAALVGCFVVLLFLGLVLKLVQTLFLRGWLQ